MVSEWNVMSFEIATSQALELLLWNIDLDESMSGEWSG